MAADSLTIKALRLAARIPKGRVSTYGAVAEALGCGKMARPVGNALGRNPKPVDVPCHRVVCSDGRIGGYVKGTQEKTRLLRREGIEVKNGRVIDLDKRVFKRFSRKARA
jgi:methylated-DNA-[protein]-cysteine S-methyltransferase